MTASTHERVNHYHATATSPGPLIVIVEYGNCTGPLAAYDFTEWHVWLFGLHARLVRTAATVS
jgi:hypothetical protein